jgi:hypothetical protein
MPGDRLFVAAQPCERPGARRAGIGHRLERREGFRGDNEKGFRRIQITDGFREVRAVNV